MYILFTKSLPTLINLFIYYSVHSNFIFEQFKLFIVVVNEPTMIIAKPNLLILLIKEGKKT